MSDAGQLRDQYRAIHHMAARLAEVSAELAKCADSMPLEICGPQTARTMETLGDISNGMDIVGPEDDWLRPIFERMHTTGWLDA